MQIRVVENSEQAATHHRIGIRIMQAQIENTFTIRTLVERYGASAESFRNWERQGLLPPVRRTPGGHRRYGLEHIEAQERLFNIQWATMDPII